VKDTADGSFYKFLGTGNNDPGLSWSVDGSVSITYNTYRYKGVQKSMQVKCNSGQYESNIFKVTVNSSGGGGSCQMTPSSSGSPTPRTITSDLVIPVTEMWDGTYADCSC